MTTPELRSLVEAAVEGDDRATAELVRATQPAVWQLCAALGSPGEEEDLVQETYLRALRGLRGFRFDCPFQLWLLSIARRVCADHVRRRTRQRRLYERLRPSEEAHQASVGHETAELLQDLTSDRRDAFVLTQMIGLSYDEAAAVIGCPVGTIRSRVARARGDLLDAVQRAQSG